MFDAASRTCPVRGRCSKQGRPIRSSPPDSSFRVARFYIYLHNHLVVAQVRKPINRNPPPPPPPSPPAQWLRQEGEEKCFAPWRIFDTQITFSPSTKPAHDNRLRYQPPRLKDSRHEGFRHPKGGEEGGKERDVSWKKGISRELCNLPVRGQSSADIAQF